jgi:hypothetical protein
MQQREFITFIGSTVAWPLAARVGNSQRCQSLLSMFSPDVASPEDAVFAKGLRAKQTFTFHKV